jgi:hypothetical protein
VTVGTDTLTGRSRAQGVNLSVRRLYLPQTPENFPPRKIFRGKLRAYNGRSSGTIPYHTTKHITTLTHTHLKRHVNSSRR